MTLPLFDKLKDALKDVCPKKRHELNEFVFLSSRNEKFSVAGMDQWIAKICEVAGVKNPIPPKGIIRTRKGKIQTYQMYNRVNSHLLRHTAIRHCLKLFPNDYKFAQKLARHSSISITLDRYGEISSEEKIKKGRKLGEIFDE